MISKPLLLLLLLTVHYTGQKKKGRGMEDTDERKDEILCVLSIRETDGL